MGLSVSADVHTQVAEGWLPGRMLMRLAILTAAVPYNAFAELGPEDLDFLSTLAFAAVDIAA